MKTIDLSTQTCIMPCVKAILKEFRRVGVHVEKDVPSHNTVLYANNIVVSRSPFAAICAELGLTKASLGKILWYGKLHVSLAAIWRLNELRKRNHPGVDLALRTMCSPQVKNSKFPWFNWIKRVNIAYKNEMEIEDNKIFNVFANLEELFAKEDGIERGVEDNLYNITIDTLKLFKHKGVNIESETTTAVKARYAGSVLTCYSKMRDVCAYLGITKDHFGTALWATKLKISLGAIWHLHYLKYKGIVDDNEYVDRMHKARHSKFAWFAWIKDINFTYYRYRFMQYEIIENSRIEAVCREDLDFKNRTNKSVVKDVSILDYRALIASMKAKKWDMSFWDFLTKTKTNLTTLHFILGRPQEAEGVLSYSEDARTDFINMLVRSGVYRKSLLTVVGHSPFAATSVSEYMRLGQEANLDSFITRVTGETMLSLEEKSLKLRTEAKKELDDMRFHAPMYPENCANIMREKQKNKDNKTTMNEDEFNVIVAGDLSTAAISKEALLVAKKLSAIHGPCHFAYEASGLQLYLADPELLRSDGPIEFNKRHLAVNLDMELGQGQWDVENYQQNTKASLAKIKKYAQDRYEHIPIPCGYCLKTNRIYTVKDLLAHRPVAERHAMFKEVKNIVSLTRRKEELMEVDSQGKTVPEWCGKTIPVTLLPEDHPAVVYLKDRGYDLKQLEEQFECKYCIEALPESQDKGRYYSRLAGGMRNTHQGRIVFTVRMNGSRVGYQSRYIDKWVDGNRYFWSPDQQWIMVEKVDDQGIPQPTIPKSERFPKGFAPHKYINATGSSRATLLMGYDAAVKWNEGLPRSERTCILVEGPLDAGKLGAPAIALLGNAISDKQAAAISKKFGRVITLMDNDAAGAKGLERIHKMLPNLDIIDVSVPKRVKDVGSLTLKEAAKLINPYIPEKCYT